MKVNYKYIRFLSLLAVLLIGSLGFYGCPSIPEFPSTPRIDFKNITFEERTFTTETGVILTSEVISLTISFEDGDGDLGLDKDNTNPPYNDFNLPLQADNSLIRLGDSDTLPPFNINDYFVPKDDSYVYEYIRYENTDSAEYIVEELTTSDTIYVIPNPRSKNIFIETYYQPNPSGEFIPYIWETAPNYQTFDGRFPRLNTEEYDRPINGELTYELENLAFSSIFRENPIIIETYILDRAGNKSNVIRSEPFRLQEVKIN